MKGDELVEFYVFISMEFLSLFSGVLEDLVLVSDTRIR